MNDKNESTTSATNNSPALTYIESLGLFYAGWHGLDAPNNPNIFVSWSLDGITYSPQVDTGIQSQNGPALTTTGNGLLMATRGLNSDSIFVANLNLVSSPINLRYTFDEVQHIRG